MLPYSCTPWSEFLFYFPFLVSLLCNLLLFAKQLLFIILQGCIPSSFSSYSVPLDNLIGAHSFYYYLFLDDSKMSIYPQSRLLLWPLDQNFQIPDQLCKAISGHFRVIISKTILRYFLFLSQTWSSSTIPCLSKSPPPLKFLPPDCPLALPISDSDELSTMVSGLASKIH